MSDLIDKDMAVEVAACRYRKAYDRWKEYGRYGDFCAAMAYRIAAYELDKLTPVPTEIIQCKDCKYMQEDKIFHQYWCNGKEVKPDHFADMQK